MAIAVAQRGESWVATYAMGGRSLTLALTFSAAPCGDAEVVVEKTGQASPFFSQSRIVAEAVQGVEQALAEARVRRWIKRMEMRDCDAPAPAQAMYLGCAIARAALAGDG